VGTVGSLVGLLVFAIGVPVVLVIEKAGSPFTLVEHLVSHPSSPVHALNHPVTDSIVVNSLVLVAWLTWAWLVACVITEILARLRGRPTSRLPASRRVQALAALVVGASMALLPSVKGYSPIRLSGVTEGPRVAQMVTLVDESFPDAAAPIRDDPVPESVSGVFVATPVSVDQGRTYIVRPGDTLWSIAGRELGSPLRWKEIAALNMGIPQADGMSLVNAGWILPGWVLRLPSVAGRAHDPIAHDPIAHDVVRSPTPYVPEPDAGTAVVTSSSVTEGELPGTDSGSQGSHEAITDHRGSSADGNRQGVPVAPFGYGLLGAGVVMVINRLRRAQQRHRPSGLRIALPDKELAGAEQRLRSSADHHAAAWVDAALRTLAAVCRSQDRRAPRVVAVRVLDHATELILGPPPDPSPIAPFEGLQDKPSWILPRSPDLLDEAQADPWVAGMDVMSPGLVTLGRGPEGLLLVDVEQAGSIAVPGEDADDVLRAMAIELATSTWSEQVNVVMVGMERVSHGRHSADPTLDVLDRVREAADLVEVLPELRHVTTERSVMLNAVGLDRTSEARLAVSGDSWDLTVVFCSSRALAANGKAVADLISLAGDGTHGLATVCAGIVKDANWLLEAGSGSMTLRMAGVPEATVWPQTLDDDAGEQIAKLVDVARHLEGVDLTTPPYDAIETRDPGPESDDGDPSPAIEILVLGPVEVVGAARPFTRAWALELVVYLAMHPGGATSDQWATHLWPNRSMAQASLHSTASAARRSLGSTATGEDHLPRSHGRLALGPGVTTDWDRFCRFAASPEPAAWKRALELIRGRPFEGLRSTDWAVFSHVQANIESLVVDVSVRRAEYCMEQEDPSGAEWSARQGLLVSPYDERLYRLLMKAADLAGNPAGVEAVMSELLQLVGGEVEPYDSVHPETYDLYRSLSRRQVPARQR
jgi:DNA-binding SARP family transcriptional activator